MEQFTVREYIVREMGFPGVLKQEIVGEIVRCKDCVHHNNAPQTMYVWCECVDGLLPKDWFCADGERRDDDEKGFAKSD